MPTIDETPIVAFPERIPSNYVPRPGPPGRPTTLTPEIEAELCRLIRKGNYPTAACNAIHLDQSTYQQWMAKGRVAAEGLTDPAFVVATNDKMVQRFIMYATFFRNINRAIAESETSLIEAWNDAAQDDWRAAAALLARRFPERWSDKRQIQVIGALDMTQVREYAVKAGLQEEEIQLVEELARAMATADSQDILTVNMTDLLVEGSNNGDD